MNQLGRLLSAITWLLVLASMVIITGGLLGRPLLFAAVPTGSMVPALMPGDLIVVLPPWALSPPGLGDVVIFRTPQERNWIVHRITGGNSTDGFVTKGDANPIADLRRVYPQEIAGRFLSGTAGPSVCRVSARFARRAARFPARSWPGAP